MKQIDIKKLVILNAPYLAFVYLFNKAASAFRLAPGADLSAKLLAIGEGFTAAFSSVMHQVRALSELDDSQPWNIFMKKINRKTLVVCPSCHEMIHNAG